MKALGSKLFAALIGLSLAVPAIAACTNCCPPEESQPTVFAPPACCGSCQTSLEKPESFSSLSVKQAFADPGSVPAVVAPSRAQLALAESDEALFSFQGARSLPSSRSPIPLRL